MFDSILGLFGDQKGAFGGYSDAMRQQSHAYDPYVNRGNQAGDQEMDLSHWLTSNPNGLQDQIAGGYQASPYQNKLMDMMSQRMNINAANSGMIRSPAAQAALNNQLTTMGGQFMNDYVNRGEQNFNTGFQGLHGLNSMGLQGLQGQQDLLTGAAQGQLQGDRSHNNAISNLFGKGVGIGLAAFGGPAGAAAGSGIASSSGGFQGAGSMNPNTGGWTGTPSTASIMGLMG